MRVLLGVSMLLTVAVAWAAGAAPEVRERAGCRAAPAQLDEAPLESATPESTTPDEGQAQLEVSTERGKWVAVEIDAAPGEDPWVPLELLPVDGETGVLVEARRATVLAQWHDRDETSWRSPSHARRGGRVSVDARVAVGAGHVPDHDGAYSAWAYVSRRAERVRLLAPLRREADVRLRVTDALGRPVRGARVASVTLAGGEPRLSYAGAFEDLVASEDTTAVEFGTSVSCAGDPTDAEGWTRVRGIPHLLDERFWITAGVEDHENYTGLTLGSFGSDHAAEIGLPAEPSWVWPPSIGIGGRCCGGRRNLKACCGRYTPARLDVVVFRRDGGVAADVQVALGGKLRTTDERGRAVFDELRPDTYVLEVRDPDFVWSKTQVELRGGESRVVELLEPAGWTTRATLLDSTGRRVPFAGLSVSSESGVEYVSVEDGVQDLALYTDENGDVELRQVHHGPVNLRFRYGSRKGSATIQEGEPYVLAQLPPP